MIERTEEALGLKPRRLTADTAYGTGKLLAWLLGKAITPHIPVWERYERTDGMFPRTEFAYDAERDVYICPNERPLRTSGTFMTVVFGTIYHTLEIAGPANSRRAAHVRR